MKVVFALASLLFVLALLWTIVVIWTWSVYKLPTRSLLQQVTRPSVGNDKEDLRRITEVARRRVGLVLKVWPAALAALIASVILLVIAS
jgi:hypothetical protein